MKIIASSKMEVDPGKGGIVCAPPPPAPLPHLQIIGFFIIIKAFNSEFIL